MSNLKERLQQIKNEYAKEFNCKSYEFLLDFRQISGKTREQHSDEIAKRYATEALKEASER